MLSNESNFQVQDNIIRYILKKKKHLLDYITVS